MTAFQRYLYCKTSEGVTTNQDRELIEMLQGEMRAGFTMLASAIGQTNAKLDQTNVKLDHAIDEFHEFRSEVNTKLSGISALLI
ncbi:MAG: hypothetical protein Q8T09_08120 [Candidatus Melainabacteria bacterium]|nr:hypothetical protein [Candidatus Melainabacteria bacterium]